MKFEVSERITTHHTRSELLTALKVQFAKVAEKVKTRGETLKVSSIEASFGSINRTDTTIVSVRPAEGGFLVVAETDYRPSAAFAVIVVLTLFSTGVLWLIPVAFYLTQKKTVRSAIEQCFQRLKNEYEQCTPSPQSYSAPIPPHRAHQHARPTAVPQTVAI